MSTEWQPGEGMRMRTRIASLRRNAPGPESPLATCPACERTYLPEMLQGEGTAAQREQWITGLCSDTCWTRYVGTED